jgi:serine/threonine protein kinase
VRPGTFIKDTSRLEERFEIKRLLESGKSYQIALATDAHLESKRVCVKAIEYEAAYAQDPEYVEGRRDALRDELEFLALPVHLLPEPLDWLELGESPVGQPPEPALVYEYQHGQTLHELVTTRYPNGLNPMRALRLFRELVLFSGELHDRKWVFRDFDPRHVIVSDDDVLHVVGCGNAVKRGERMNVYKMNTNPAYTAPEIRQDLSGKVVRPACDFYSLGCLFSFMLTGVEPTPTAEAPLEPDAYDALQEQVPTSHKLLIARCLQPIAHKRFAKASELAAFCAPDNLPTATSKGFGLLALPMPWEGPEDANNRGVRSKISNGPLVSSKPPRKAPPADPAPASGRPAPGARPDEGAVVPAPQTAPEEKDKPDSRTRAVTIVVAFVIFSIVMFILAVGSFFLMTLLGLV